MGGLTLRTILLWNCGAAFIDPITAALVVEVLMVMSRIVTRDDIGANCEAWKALTLPAGLVTLSDGLNRTGFIA
jgi:L-tartrate/succinate antiporter